MLPVQWVPLAGDTCSEFWGDFSITQPRVAHASHPGTLRCPFFRHDIFSGFSPLRWLRRQLRCFATLRAMTACTGFCCPAQPPRKQSEEFGATLGYSGSRSAKDDSLESEGSHRKVRCSSVRLGALICPRDIFSLKAYFQICGSSFKTQS